MPFDATPTDPAADYLRRAKAVIATPSTWCKDVMRQGEDRYCAIGAMAAVSASSDRDFYWKDDANSVDALQALVAALRERGRDEASSWELTIAVYNDRPETTHADIMSLFDDAIRIRETMVRA